MQCLLQFQTTVLAGQRIEINALELPEGCPVTVLVLVNDPEPVKRCLSEILAGYPGGQLYRSAEDVDAYLREEREAWGG